MCSSIDRDRVWVCESEQCGGHEANIPIDVGDRFVAVYSFTKQAYVREPS